MKVAVVEVGKGKLLCENVDEVFVKKGCRENMLQIWDLERREDDGNDTSSEEFFLKSKALFG